MSEDVINGVYRGVMADHEVERFKLWDDAGDEMIVSSACVVGANIIS
jgi:hypothetical protein